MLIGVMGAADEAGWIHQSMPFHAGFRPHEALVLVWVALVEVCPPPIQVIVLCLQVGLCLCLQAEVLQLRCFHAVCMVAG